MKLPAISLLSLCICCIPAIGQSFSATDFRPVSTLPPSAWEWLRDTASYSLDTSVQFNNRPTLRMSGFYPLTVVSGKAKSHEGKMNVSGHIRIDSLDGEVDIAVRLWESPVRKNSQHIAEFHCVLSAASPGQWQEFSLEAPLCWQAAAFDCEVKIKGTGDIHIGEMTVSFPSTVRAMTSKAKNTHRTYPGGSGVGLADPELFPEQVENLVVLGKVWGFLKYFHPTVREGRIDWDSELFRMIPTVCNAAPAKRNSILAEWCRSLGDIQTSEDTAWISSCDALKWIFDEYALGRELSAILRITAAAGRSPWSRYLYQVPYIQTIEDRNERSHPRMSFDDAGLKLLSVFRIWNYVQYFNPYRQLADRPWEEALMYAVPAVVLASDRESYGNVLRTMAVYTDDSHSFAAYMPGGFLRQLIRLAAIPENMRYAAPFISTLYADGKYIVTWTCRSDTCDLHRGDAVIAVNGKPVESLIEKNSHVIPSSNPGSIQRETALSISFSAGDSASYTVIRGKDILTLKPKMMPFKKFRRALYSSGIRQSTLTWFRGNELSPFDVIGDSVAYIHAEDISAHDFRKCLEYRRLIVDLRNYPMNMIQMWLMSLMPSTSPVALAVTPDFLKPGSFTRRISDFTGRGHNFSPDRRIVLLVDSRTQSASEYLAMQMQCSPQVTVVGSTTAGADGNVVQLSLPGDFVFQTGGAGIEYPDGSQCQRNGVRIDHIVPQKTEDLASGSDTQIEYALTLFQSPTADTSEAYFMRNRPSRSSDF